MKLFEGIDRYLADRAPMEWEKVEVRKYRERIHGILAAEFDLLGFFQSGSFQHGTAITPYADVDYIARIHYSQRPSSSTTILTKVRDVLRRDLSEANTIQVARPTVTIDFNALVTRYEVTPAFYERTDADETVLLIPASGGGWRESAPKAHLKFVSEVDRKHYGNVRELARLLKAWKYEHMVPVSSFYLEMRAAEYGKNNESIWSLISLRTIVSKLISTDLAAMNDPAKLVNRISACSAEASRKTALSKLRALEENLIEARRANDAGQGWEMNQALQAIWGSSFPFVEAKSA